MQTNNSKGFSLIELLVTIVIIGILASIAIPAYQRYVVNGKIREALAVLDSYQEYTIKLYARKGVLPTSNAILFPNGDSAGQIDNNNKSLNLNYVDQVYAANGSNYILLGARLKTSGPITDTNNFIYYAGIVDNNGGFTWQCGQSASRSNNILIKYLPSNCMNGPVANNLP